MADRYLEPICNSLLAGYLRRPCLQSGYQYQHHAAALRAAAEEHRTVCDAAVLFTR